MRVKIHFVEDIVLIVFSSLLFILAMGIVTLKGLAFICNFLAGAAKIQC